MSDSSSASAAAPFTNAAHVPSAASPSPVLQLSYEAASSAHVAAPPAASSSSDAAADAALSPHDLPLSLSPQEIAHYDSLLAAQGTGGVKPFFLAKYEKESVKNWDRFYKKNADRFYKDRHYLTNEFKELADTLEADRIVRGEPALEPASSDDAAATSGEMDDSEGAPSASPPAAAAAGASSPLPPVVPQRPIHNPLCRPSPLQRSLLEVGCGVGNAMFPLLRQHPSLFVFGVDCSKNAIQTVQNHPDYVAAEEAAGREGSTNAAAAAVSNGAIAAAESSCVAVMPAAASPPPIGRCAAWVVDLVTESLPPLLLSSSDVAGGGTGGGVDFATLIFVLSAIHPDQMLSVLRKVHGALKRDRGVLFVRDYCMYDLAQLRFAKTSKLGPSWYVRQDGTRSYFFRLDELVSLVEQAGFEIIAAATVRKRVVNRKERSEMSRRFVQIRARAVGEGTSGADSSAETATASTPAAAAASAAP